MNTKTNKTLLILLTWGFTLCSVVTAGNFQNAQQKAKGDVEQAMDELYLVDEGIKNKLEQFIEGEREQYLAEIEQLKSLLAEHTKTIKDLQNKKDRIVNIQKKEIIQHGETQESCDMQVEIDDLNDQIKKLQQGMDREKQNVKHFTNKYYSLQAQFVSANSQPIDEEYGYIDYLWSPSVIGTAATATTAIASYIIYKYATARNVPAGNQGVDPAFEAGQIMANALGLAGAINNLGELDALTGGASSFFKEFVNSEIE